MAFFLPTLIDAEVCMTMVALEGIKVNQHNLATKVSQLEEVKEAQPRVRYPRCIDIARACPPEDIGGVWGFVDFVEAISNPDHEQHEAYLEWNDPFDCQRRSKTVSSRRRILWRRIAAHLYHGFVKVLLESCKDLSDFFGAT